MYKAPIAFFAYNRPSHTKLALESLARNDGAGKSKLFIFCDGPKRDEDKDKIRAIGSLVKSRKWCGDVEVIEKEENQGLANSIIGGVTDIIKRYGRIIVVEDDLILSPNFLNYMNTALDKYERSEKVFSITGFNYPTTILKIPPQYRSATYFGYRAHSWSWATWKDRWDKVDFEMKDFNTFIKDRESQKLFKMGGEDLVDMLKAQMEGRLDSWAIRFCYGQFKNNGYTLYPVRTLAHNIGLDNSGTHCGTDKRLTAKPLPGAIEIRWSKRIEVDQVIAVEFRKIFKYTLKHRLAKAVLRR